MNKIFRLLKFALPVLAAIGVGILGDKYAAGKVPGYPSDGLGIYDKKKIAWFAGAAIIGTLALRFIGKKFRIGLFK